ncbi:MAG: type II secretion system F family protein, partial [Planctomycetales bacterium]|nr:type II secretion system F family protein [Planctomycetales bacterium]
MMQFRYIAEDAQGVRHEGELSANSDDTARQQLVERGLRVVELQPLGDAHGKPVSKLSPKESEEVVIAIAELSSSELPLVEGLRAAADESVSSRVARALRQIAADVEQGYALDSVMGERSKFL